MVFVDWLVVALYAAIVLVVGLAFRKRAGGSLAEFFVSGRSLPWYIAGTSMVATTFAADTPLAVTGLTLSDGGIAGNWLWWSMALTSMLTVVVFSRLWRRSGLLTDLEFTELRYSGRPAAALRGFRALWLGVPINVIIMGGFVTVAMLKIVQVLLFGGRELDGLEKLAIVGTAFAVAGLYSTVSGLWGVVITDCIQFALAMAGSIVLAALSVDAAGGMSVMTEKLAALPGGENLLSFFPDPGTALFWTVVVFLTVQWWASWYPGAEPGGGGYGAQRMLSAKDERHSFLASLWFTIAHYAIRPWPWIITALAALVVIPGAAGMADKEALYPGMVAALMPAGLKGLMLTAFFAAYMSTVTTHLNWGASYVINDFYKRFIKKEKSERHYIAAARLVTLGLMLLSVIPALLFESIRDAWVYLLSVGAGTGLVLILRWFVPRINAWSEISAMGASLVGATVLTLLRGNKSVVFSTYGALDDALALAVTVAFSTAVWVTVTLLTRPEPAAVLAAFRAKIGTLGVSFGSLALRWAAGCLMVYAFLFGMGKILLAQAGTDRIIGILLLAAGAGIFTWFVRRETR